MVGSKSAAIIFDDKDWDANRTDLWEARASGTLEEHFAREKCSEWVEELTRAEQRDVVVVRFNESRSIAQFRPGSQVVVTGTLQKAGTYFYYQDIERESIVLETDSISSLR